MASNQMDAVTSFAYLIENIPKWKEQISNLAKHTAERHEEFKTEYTRLVQQARPRRIRTQSVCSLHTNKDTEDDTHSKISAPPTPSNRVEISPLEAGNKYIYAQANRKRKPGTSFGSGASGPLKFRSKQQVVIYYDSSVQEKLESLVKAVGASRNNLRKGKMSYTVSKGLQLPSLRRGLDNMSANSSLENIRSSLSRGSPKPVSMKNDGPEANPMPAGEAAFVRIDKDLEACQNICETAAHQFLRDGDCKLELDTAFETLNNVLELATTTHIVLKSEAEQEEKTEETNSNGDSTHTTSDSTLVEKSSREYLNFNRKSSTQSSNSEALIFKQRSPVLNTTPTLPLVADIEVDDESDASSIEINISHYRLNNPGRLRT